MALRLGKAPTLRVSFAVPGETSVSHPSSRLSQTVRVFVNRRTVLLAALLAGGYALYAYPPTESVGHGELGVRINRWTGTTTATGEGAVLMIPGLHELRRYPLHDRLYKPERSAKADGPAPFQSIEGLSLGVELAIRYALDESKTDAISRTLPEQIDSERLEPAVQGVIYKIFARYTVREIFSSKRQELQDVLEAELKPRLAADGIVLRSVLMGNVDLPSDYRAGMDKLLAVELETEKMKYTLDLKEKQVHCVGVARALFASGSATVPGPLRAAAFLLFRRSQLRDARDQRERRRLRERKTDRPVFDLVLRELGAQHRHHVSRRRVERVVLLPAREVQHGAAVLLKRRHVVRDGFFRARNALADGVSHMPEQSAQRFELRV